MNKASLLAKIEELSKVQMKPNQVSVDTLVLVFRASKSDINLLLQVLEDDGLINIHCPETTSKRPTVRSYVTLP